MVPAFVPLVPDVMESQSSPEVTAAVQLTWPAPALATAKVVVPAV